MTKKYLYIYFLTIGIIFISVGLVSFIVDPYGIFLLEVRAGFNQQKEGVRNKIRFVKALELPMRKPSTLLMGSSRVHDALNPAHPRLQQFSPVYNYGVDMNHITETGELLRHAARNSKIKRVILGLDLFMFNSLQVKNPNFDETLIGRKVEIADYLQTIFSLDALQDSIKTFIGSSKDPSREEFLSNGYRPQAFYGLKNFPAAHYYTTWIFLSKAKGNTTRYYADFQLNDSVFTEFEELLNFCQQQGIEVILYINPAHANLDGEGLVALGKWDAMEQWKRKITRISNAHDIKIWDFSGYNSITTEEVKNPMKYYWDSSHFNEEVGNMILNRILSDGALVPNDFGILLNEKNIESHLSSINKDRGKYIEKYANKMKILHQEYREIILGAPLDLSRISGMY